MSSGRPTNAKAETAEAALHSSAVPKVRKKEERAPQAGI